MKNNWNTMEPTPNQKRAIESYERATNTRIYCKNKQDAHAVISLFCAKGITFRNGFIEGTTVKYKAKGFSREGQTLFNNSYKIKNNSLDILDKSIQIFDDYDKELRYDEDARKTFDAVFGVMPY